MVYRDGRQPRVSGCRLQCQPTELHGCVDDAVSREVRLGVCSLVGTWFQAEAAKLLRGWAYGWGREAGSLLSAVLSAPFTNKHNIVLMVKEKCPNTLVYNVRATAEGVQSKETIYR